MSQWGTPKRFGVHGRSFVAIPHVATPAFECANPGDRIDWIIVVDQDRPGLDWTAAQKYVGSQYAEWLQPKDGERSVEWRTPGLLDRPLT